METLCEICNWWPPFWYGFMFAFTPSFVTLAVLLAGARFRSNLSGS
jgi:hypothetical protein